MKNEEFFTKWTVVSFFIGFFIAMGVVVIITNNFILGSVFVMAFYSALIFHSFIHSFTYSTFRNKIIGASMDMFPLIIYFMTSVFMGDKLDELFFSFLAYLIPIPLIATISTSLQYLYKRFVKK